jgi:hypothetical protein
MRQDTERHARRAYTVTFQAQPWNPDTFADEIREQLLLLSAHIEHIHITCARDG